MTACGKTAQESKVCLHMEDEDMKALANGCKSHRTLEKLVKSWKVKAILPAVEESEVATACPVQRAVEVVLPAAGSWSKAPVVEDEHNIPLDMGELAATVAHTMHAAKVAKAHELTIECSKHVAASTVGDDADKSSSSVAEVKIIGEHTAEEKVICESRVVPPRPVKPLPACAAPAPLSEGKGKAVELDEVLQLMLAENVDLKEEIVCLKEVLASVHYHAGTEQAEMISMSNKAYSIAQDWGTVEMKLSELLD
ncbi:hypothetical protein EV702DRAFT_1042603 [Suillus placidus]|uniref:Uncharacterized protein n=1 Tax=Suillus placidus TaxID=48579 RepID=A0A9P7A3Q1_9AGAM|nr:hypothetical protein EV702DRAFT_1042603 [Suillus placidus]